MRTFQRFFILVFLLSAITAMGSGKQLLLVSIVPQLETVRAIAGDGYTVRPLIPPGMAAEHFSPNRESLNAISSCRLYFGIGVGWEEALLSRMRPLQKKYVDCSRDIPRLPSDHGVKGDPHIWLSVSRLRKCADHVLAALEKLAPQQSAEFRKRHAEYLLALERLQQELNSAMAPLRGRTILVYHPSFAYFLDEYGMKQVAVEHHGHEATASHLHSLLRQAGKEKFRAVFVQPQFNPKQASTMARELKLPLFTLDPLPEKLSDGLRSIAQTIVKAHAE